MSWRSVHIGKENDQFALKGVKVWQQEWRWLNGQTVRLPNPLDSSQTESFSVCEVGPTRSPVRFAAARLPSRLWAFYVND